MIFDKTHVEFLDKHGRLVVEAQRKGNLYFLESRMESSAAVNEKEINFEEWHKRFGHLNEANLNKLITKKMVHGFPQKLLKESLECETYVLGKQVCTPFPKFSENRCEKLLERIHYDVCVPMRINSIGGARYFVTFIDEKSRWVEVRFLKNKSDVKSEFLKFKAYLETQQDRKIKI